MTVEDLLIAILALLSVGLAILVWLVQRREKSMEEYVETEEW